MNYKKGDLIFFRTKCGKATNIPKKQLVRFAGVVDGEAVLLRRGSDGNLAAIFRAPLNLLEARAI